jgi:NTP pyrophosphatase (non-canonical NTP hydrolase)
MADQTTTVADLLAQVAQFVAEREWQPYHTPKSLSMSIAIEAAELMELFQWHGNQASLRAMDEPDKRGALAGELADVLIYALALANVLDLDVADAIEAKLASNQQRYPPGQMPSRYRHLTADGDLE